MKPLLVLDAAAFCFGPVSTLMAIVEALPADAVECVLLASGTTESFAQASDRAVQIVHCDTEDVADLRAHAALLDRCDLFVSNTNPVSARFALERGCRVAYVDTLFWMWDAIDARVAQADAFIVQDFAGIEENQARLGPIARFHRVGPLIKASTPSGARDQRLCMVSFGGMQSPLSSVEQVDRYARLMTTSVLRAVEGLDRELLFCGHGPVMERLAATTTDPRARFGFLPHDAYLAALARCGAHLVAPGLTGAYEARASGAPTCLLLGQNYSQQLQAEVFLADGDWPFTGVEWRAVYPDADLPPYLPEPEAVARVNALIARLADDPAAQARYARQLRAALLALPDRPSRPANTSGAAAAARIILDLVDGSRAG